MYQSMFSWLTSRAVLILWFLFGFFSSSAVTKTSVASGNWNLATIWSPSGVPVLGDDVIIQSGNKILLNVDASVHSVTVNALAELNFSPQMKLTLNGNLFVSGKIDLSGGNITQQATGAQFNISNSGLFIWNPADNSSTGATLFVNSIENFSSQSTLVIKKWYSFTTVPLGSVVTGNFGNVSISTIVGGSLFEWDQKNEFETHKILGTLTIDQGWVVLDKSGAISNTTIGSIMMSNMNSFLDFHSGTHSGSFVVNTDSIHNIGGEINGIYNGNGSVTLNVTGNFTNLGNVELIYNTGLPNTGMGNCILNVGGKFKQTTGDLRGVFNLSTVNSGSVTMNFGSIEQTGGVIIAYYACNSSGALNKITVTGDLSVCLTNVNDKFRINGLTSLMGQFSKCKSELIVNGNLNLSGITSAEFTSSGSVGAENVHIAGDVLISGLTNNFNFGSHSTTLQFDGKLKVMGGTTCLSRFPGTTQITVSNDFIVSSGTLAVKGSTGVADVNLNGNFIQSGGTIFFHSNTLSPTGDVVNIILQGIFNQLNGVLSFDDNGASIASHQLNLKGSLFSVDGGAIITRAGAGTSGTFGKINYLKSGVLQYKRNSGSAYLEQTKQTIANGCTVDVLVGNFQLASHQNSDNDFLKVADGGTLQVHSAQVVTNFKAANTGVRIEAGGRLITQNVNGLYNSSGTASLKNSGNLNYYLDAASIVEYSGSDVQTVTGINDGIATSTQHKYGILKINFQGSPNSEFVKLTNGNVFVRNQLQLQSGELNLSNNILTIESGSANAIQRASGYIKSESEFSKLKWKSISQGNYVVPFASNSSVYLPISFNPTSGMSDVVFYSYHTAHNNLPFPQGVISLNIDGKELSTSSAIDRWYGIIAANIRADVKLAYDIAENTTSGLIGDAVTVIANTNTGWKGLNSQGTIASTNTGTIEVSNTADFSNWAIVLKKDFTLSQFTFDAVLENGSVNGEWSYSNEKDNDRYEVERSQDNQSFESIQSVQGDGTGSYKFTDTQPLDASSFYRIKFISVSGVIKYSDEVEINKTAATVLAHLEISNVFPNPFTSTFNLEYSVGVAGEAKIELVNEAGQLVFTDKQMCESGANTYIYPNRNPLPPGMYVLVLSGNKSRATKKVYKK